MHVFVHDLVNGEQFHRGKACDVLWVLLGGIFWSGRIKGSGRIRLFFCCLVKEIWWYCLRSWLRVGGGCARRRSLWERQSSLGTFSIRFRRRARHKSGILPCLLPLHAGAKVASIATLFQAFRCHPVRLMSCSESQLAGEPSYVVVYFKGEYYPHQSCLISFWSPLAISFVFFQTFTNCFTLSCQDPPCPIDCQTLRVSS